MLSCLWNKKIPLHCCNGIVQNYSEKKNYSAVGSSVSAASAAFVSGAGAAGAAAVLDSAAAALPSNLALISAKALRSPKVDFSTLLWRFLTAFLVTSDS